MTRADDGAIRCQIRFTGGQHHTLTLRRPLTAAEQHTTSPATMQLISQLLDDHPFDEIAAILNGRGITGGWGRAFTVPNLAALCRARGLGTHASRLRAAGMLTPGEIAADFKVTPQTIGKWRRCGLITGRRTDGRGECLYHPCQRRPEPADKTAARRPEATRHLLTSRQLAARLGVASGTILRWTQLGLLTVAATDNRGFNLYQPGQPPPAATRSPPRAARQAPATPSPAGSSPPGTASAAPPSTNGTSSDSSSPSAPTAPAGTSTTPPSKHPAPDRSVPHAATAPQNVRPQCHHQFQKAKHPRSPHPEPDHQHEVQCEARSFVTPVKTAATISSSQREIVLASVRSSGMSSCWADQS